MYFLSKKKIRGGVKNTSSPSFMSSFALFNILISNNKPGGGGNVQGLNFNLNDFNILLGCCSVVYSNVNLRFLCLNYPKN